MLEYVGRVLSLSGAVQCGTKCRVDVTMVHYVSLPHMGCHIVARSRSEALEGSHMH